MNVGELDPLGTEFLTAVYEVDGPEMQARARAERICLDQTIEADADLLAPPLRAKIVERLPIAGQGSGMAESAADDQHQSAPAGSALAALEAFLAE